MICSRLPFTESYLLLIGCSASVFLDILLSGHERWSKLTTILAHDRISYRIVFYIVLHLSQAMCSPLWFSGWYDYYPKKCKVSSKCL